MSPQVMMDVFLDIQMLARCDYLLRASCTSHMSIPPFATLRLSSPMIPL